MNYIDYIVIILLLFSFLGGLKNGFIYELASLVGLVAGVWGAIKFSGATRDFLEFRLNFTGDWVQILAFGLTFAAIAILVHIIAKAIEHALEMVNMGALNRIFGGLLALFKSAFFFGLFFMFIDTIDEMLPVFPEKKIKEAKMYEPMRDVAIFSFPFFKGVYEDFKGPDRNKEKKNAEPDSLKKS
ncbi:MAG TPA: CvpA family protein [Prolixibacteraceae bacterium]|jgi:membrane protein required for colicin V production|nr:CvpA family protein [Prolixibacteraceae bacterium]